MENSTAAYFNGSELEEEYAKILEVCKSLYIWDFRFYVISHYHYTILIYTQNVLWNNQFLDVSPGIFYIDILKDRVTKLHS